MDSPDASLVRTALTVAQQAARAGGARTKEWFGGRIRAETKPDGSPVTGADRASEREIRRVIRTRFPTHTITGEEFGTDLRDPRYRWIVDPLDGTKSFIHGVPLYSVLVGFVVDDEPVVGAAYTPILGDLVAAGRGLGCRWNGRPARVSRVDRLADATLVSTSVRGLESAGVPFRRFISATRTQRGWGDGYGFTLVATGRVDACVDTDLHPWDVTALTPILSEAGGRLTDWEGRATIDSSNYAGSNGLLHSALLRLVRSRGRPGHRPR